MDGQPTASANIGYKDGPSAQGALHTSTANSA
jgi:hypothetical protein